MALSELSFQIAQGALCILYILGAAVIVALFFVIMLWCEGYRRDALPCVSTTPESTIAAPMEYDITPDEETDEDNVIFNH